MPAEGGYRRFTPGQRATPVSMFNDPLDGLEALLRSVGEGLDIDKNPAGWIWRVAASGLANIRPMRTTSVITAWDKTSKAYGSGTAREAILDTAAGTLDYGADDVTIYNMNPGAIEDDKAVWVGDWGGLTWVLTESCLLAV